MLDFTKLDPSFTPLAQQLIQEMKDKGYKVVPYYGIRTLAEQAKFYRQSRPTAAILEKIKELRDQDCGYLAQVLEDVGPQKTGPWATNALPGQSYHQFGLAMDCLIYPGSDTDYKIYADTASRMGLTGGYYFKSRDMGHVQLGSGNIPHGWSLKQINDHFREIQ